MDAREYAGRAGVKAFKELGELFGGVHANYVEGGSGEWVDYDAKFMQAVIHDYEHAVPSSFFGRIQEVAGLTEEEVSDLRSVWISGHKLPDELRRKKYGHGS